MMLNLRDNRGQVLVMVTLALFAMCGMLGLAVDLGWSYFVKKSAQSAADAAALAAAQAAYDNIPAVGPYTCSTPGLTCVSVPTPCPEALSGTTNIERGCMYAQRNGFRVNGNGGRQNVMMTADVTFPPPTAPGVVTDYWVTVRASEQIPQLFSALLGNTLGISSARATAAVVKSAATGSLILLNRENDCIPMEGGNQTQCGVNLLVQANDNQGMYALQADGGISLASTKSGQNREYAGENQGGGTVQAPFTFIRGAGTYENQGSASWVQTPQNRKPDNNFFRDPMRGKYQPPPPVGLTEPAAFPNGVRNGIITGSDDPNSPLVLQPGAYYASAQDRQGNWVATGEPVHITGSVRFSDGGTGFSEYVFFGGVSVGQQGQGVTHLAFDPGRYVFAGRKTQTNGDPNPVFDITTNLTMTDGSQPSVQNANAGEIFIFTDTNYVGWDWTTQTAVPLQIPARVQPVAGALKFGMSGFQAGANNDMVVNLHGINKQSAQLPANLKAFEAPILLWQDQTNSVLKYYDDPSNPTSFNMPCVIGKLPSDQCANSRLDSNKSPELFFKASPGSFLYGVIYQPRGAWTTLQGGSGYSGPLQIVSGGFKIQGNALLHMAGVNDPIMVPAVTLVE